MRGRLRALLLACACIAAFQAASAAPTRPAADDVILEKLPPASLALRRLRGEVTQPTPSSDLASALAAARRYVELGQVYADPRAYGYAQAALGVWWQQDAGATPELLVMRARILQFGHRFADALAQLKAALAADPFQADAWLLLASIEQTQGNPAAARGACLHVLQMADPLVGAVCAATTASLSGHADQAEPLLARALRQPTAATPSVRAWAWTALAEIRARSGDDQAAEDAFRQALALQPDDVYARAAYADLLLDAGRHADALRALGDVTQADALLLRAAIAAARAHAVDARGLRDDLAARFAEARARGDETHLREQARFLLDVDGDAAAALPLAQRNFAVQREPADARVLLDAALAAHQPQAAAPVREWMTATGIDARPLTALAARLEAPRE